MMPDIYPEKVAPIGLLMLQYIMEYAHSDVTMDAYNYIANKQDIREEVERYARAAGN